MNVLQHVVYDVGALIAAERNQEALWRAHRSYLTAGGVPLVPAPFVAQVCVTEPARPRWHASSRVAKSGPWTTLSPCG